MNTTKLRLFWHGMLLTIVSVSQIAFSFAQSGFYSDELNNLIKNVGIKPEFKDYKPRFSVKKEIIAFLGPHGKYEEEKWFIMDGDKYVAIYSPGEKPSLDVFGHSPYAALKQIDLPVRHHNATLLGTRLTTSVWYDKWGISGDDHQFNFSEGGDSISLTESQVWTPQSNFKRNGKSIHRFTFKCDPYFGYIVNINCYLQSDDCSKTTPEFINFMPPDVSNPWPDEYRFAYTVYSPNDAKNKNSYMKFANNLAAGNLSDEVKHDWGKGFSVRSGGFIAMVDEQAWSPALFRDGNLFFAQRTCDVWLDQHNIVHFPDSPDTEGKYVLNPRFLFIHFPPEMSTYLIENSDFQQFELEKSVMIRLGVIETFEDQPLPLTYPQAALTKGFWQKDFEISETIAKNGKKSLLIEGITETEASEPMANFIHCPQVPLQPNTKYRLQAYVKIEGDSTKAFISANLYEWSPRDKNKLLHQKTQETTNGKWTKISLRFKTPDYDPFVDVRFMVVGKGKAYFDDFQFKSTSNKKHRPNVL